MSPFIPPARAVRGLEILRSAAFSLYQSLLPGEVNLTEMIGAAWFAQAIHAAADLGIADVLASGPASAAEIAAEVRADPDALDRLLRLLVSRKVFAQRRDGRYRLNRNARPLRAGPGSLRGFALFVGSAAHREHWSALSDSVRSGSPAVQRLRGEPFFAYIERNQELAGLFARAMAGIAALTTPLVLAVYDFIRYPVVADIGGGRGEFLADILDQAPATHGVLLELAPVAAQARTLLKARGLADRCAVRDGSFFAEVPAGADCYVLKHIVHDWPDDEAVRLLRRVHAAMGSAATLVIIDVVLRDGSSPHPGKLTDLEMLVSTGGRERTAAQLRSLLDAAGFSWQKLIPTAGPASIVEARPRQHHQR